MQPSQHQQLWVQQQQQQLLWQQNNTMLIQQAQQQQQQQASMMQYAYQQGFPTLARVAMGGPRSGSASFDCRVTQQQRSGGAHPAGPYTPQAAVAYYGHGFPLWVQPHVLHPAGLQTAQVPHVPMIQHVPPRPRPAAPVPPPVPPPAPPPGPPPPPPLPRGAPAAAAVATVERRPVAGPCPPPGSPPRPPAIAPGHPAPQPQQACAVHIPDHAAGLSAAHHGQDSRATDTAAQCDQQHAPQGPAVVGSEPKVKPGFRLPPPPPPAAAATAAAAASAAASQAGPSHRQPAEAAVGAAGRPGQAQATAGPTESAAASLLSAGAARPHLNSSTVPDSCSTCSAAQPAASPASLTASESTPESVTAAAAAAGGGLLEEVPSCPAAESAAAMPGAAVAAAMPRARLAASGSECAGCQSTEAALASAHLLQQDHPGAAQGQELAMAAGPVSAAHGQLSTNTGIALPESPASQDQQPQAAVAAAVQQQDTQQVQGAGLHSNPQSPQSGAPAAAAAEAGKQQQQQHMQEWQQVPAATVQQLQRASRRGTGAKAKPAAALLFESEQRRVTGTAAAAADTAAAAADTAVKGQAAGLSAAFRHATAAPDKAATVASSTDQVPSQAGASASNKASAHKYWSLLDSTSYNVAVAVEYRGGECDARHPPPCCAQDEAAGVRDQPMATDRHGSNRSSGSSGDSSSSAPQQTHCLHMRSSSQQVADGACDGLHSGSGRSKGYVHLSPQQEQLVAASDFQQSTAGILAAAGALVSSAATRQRQQQNSNRGSTSSTCTEMTAAGAGAGADGAQHSVNHTATQQQHVQPRLAQNSQAAVFVAASEQFAAGGALIRAQQRAQTRQQQHQKKEQEQQAKKLSQQLQQKQVPQQPRATYIASGARQSAAAASASAAAAPSKAGGAARHPAQRTPKGLQHSKPASKGRAGARPAAAALQQSAAGQRARPSTTQPTQRQPATTPKQSRQAMPQQGQLLKSQRAALLQAMKLQPPPPDTAEAKRMQAAFQYALFADHAAYVMGLLQPCAAAKLGCLMRLAAHDLQAILAQPQPLELLDTLWEQHRQQG